MSVKENENIFMYATDRLFFSKYKMNGEALRLSRSRAGHPNYNAIASFQTESTRKEKFTWVGILLCVASGLCFLAGYFFFTKNLKIFNINLVTQEHVHQDGLSRGQVSVLMADAAAA